jgi:Uma2 family endonuclease
MPHSYEELLAGEPHQRAQPAGPHELLCNRLHAWVRAALPANSTLELLPRRTVLELDANNHLCPDLALRQKASGQLYLVAEVLQPGDHHRDTVVKKELYLAQRVPRCWIVDSRYHNVEVYGTGEYGFRLEGILAGQDRLIDPALPELSRTMDELFAKPCP